MKFATTPRNTRRYCLATPITSPVAVRKPTPTIKKTTEPITVYLTIVGNMGRSSERQAFCVLKAKAVGATGRLHGFKRDFRRTSSRSSLAQQTAAGRGSTLRGSAGAFLPGAA